MNKISLSGVMLVLCGGLLAAEAQKPTTPPQPQDPEQKRPQFETRADVVLVDVSVTDRDGNPVNNLSPSDFALEVNGQPRPIHTVQFISSRGADTVAEVPRLAEVSTNIGPTTGRVLLFLIDENYLRVGGSRAVLHTAEQVMSTLAPADLVGVARLPTGRGGVEFTTDRNRVRRALTTTMGNQMRPTEDVRLSEAAAFENNDRHIWDQVVQRECGQDPTSAPGGAAAGATGGFTYELCRTEMEAQAKTLLTEAGGRTRQSVTAMEQLASRLALLNTPVNIVMISEGLFLGRERATDLTTLARLAANARISFFVVQPDESLFDMEKPKILGTQEDQVLGQGLQELAGLTRGEYFKVSNAGAGAFQRIARQLSGYYLLGFEPTDADRTSRERKIKVEVKRRGLTVRARSTYAVANDAATTAATTPTGQLEELLKMPLPSAGLPMRVASYTVTAAQEGRVRVIISAEIGEAATEPAEWPIGLMVIDKDDKIVARSAGPMKLAPASGRAPSPRLLLTTMVMEPGEFTLRLAALQPDGASGAVHHTIDARLENVAGNAVKASDLILSTAVNPNETPRPTPTSVIDSESMTAVLELTGTDPQKLGRARVRVQIAESETAPALVTSDTQIVPRNDTQRAFASTMKLTMLPPGEYVARAVVSVPGEGDTRITRSFRLDPVAAPAGAARTVTTNPDDDAPIPVPAARIVAPVSAFSLEAVLKPEVVRGFIDEIQKVRPVSPGTAALLQQARQGTFASPPADGKAPPSDDAALHFLRGLSALEKKQAAQAAAYFQLSLKSASEFLGAAFYLGAVHAAQGRDNDAVGAWQMSLIGDSRDAVYPHLVDALLRIGDGQGALELIAEAPNAWPSDDARLRRVVTAQAMLGQFTPALETLTQLLQKQPDDVDLLYIAIQALYKQANERALSPGEIKRFDDYTSRYIAKDGPEKALVQTWRRFVIR